MPKLTRPTLDVVLFDGADIGKIEGLLLAVKRAAASTASRRLGDIGELDAATQEYDEAVAEAVPRGVTLKIEALPRRRWRELVAEHPPRPDVKDEGGEVVESYPDDHALGFNFDSMADDLVRACIAEGQFDSRGERDEFLDDLSDGNFSRLYSAAIRLNQDGGPDPKVRLSSASARTSAETSESPARLG